jgi:hypothetical protein
MVPHPGTGVPRIAYSLPMRRPLHLCVFALLSAVATRAQQLAPPPTAASIMAQVAAHQDQAEAARSHYVYVQHAKVDSKRGKTLMCEEITDYRITPTEHGSQRQLLKIDGRLLIHGRYVDYTELSPTQGKPEDDPGTLSISIGGDDADRDMVENMRDNLIGVGSKSEAKPDAKSDAKPEAKSDATPDSKPDQKDVPKDNINAHLFPLTSKEQTAYDFRLLGTERLNNRDVYHLEFRPKDKSDYAWKGDAWIDTASLDPVAVSTNLSRRVPLAVRTLLGTNVPGLGFTVVYAPQPDGVWFPVSFSTEFEIHVLFFFRRTIIIDAHNRDFEKTHVTTRIVPETSQVEAPQP